MLRNYFLVAMRHLKRQPNYTILNVVGLTIGIASSLLIALYLNQEISYDHQHANKDRIYRVSSDFTEPDNAFRWAVTQVPLGRTLKEEYQEVEQFTRVVPAGKIALEYEGTNYFVEKTYMVDSTVFDVFTFKILQGDMESALNAPNAIALSQSMAKKIFKDQNPIGELVKTTSFSYEVTAVYEDMPKTSHLIANAMVSFSTNQRYYNSQSWGGFNIYTYVLLNEFVDPL
ncbi:MAG: ABC transporter permease, partial [Bacteroidota bacterium]